MTYQGNKWKHFGNILEIFWKQKWAKRAKKGFAKCDTLVSA